MFERKYVNTVSNESSASLIADVQKNDWDLEPDPVAVTNFLLFGKKDCTPRTFYKTVRQYWTVPRQDQNPSYAPVTEEDKKRFKAKLMQALNDELGKGTTASFLSGGLDTTTITAFTRLPTISAVYEYNVEEEYIDLAVRELGVKNQKILITGKDIIKNIDECLKLQEEPFRSTSVIAEYIVYKTVGKQRVFCGQGADELLGGYEYMLAPHILSTPLLQKLPELVKVFQHNSISLPGFAYAALPFSWKKNIQTRMKRKFFTPVETRYKYRNGSLANIIQDHVRKDSLPELLNYAYKNTRLTGTEIAMPFLHKEVIKECLHLPMTAKIHDGRTKYILRETGENLVPREILERKRKMGFSTPEREWMIGELGDVMAQGFDRFKTKTVNWKEVEYRFFRWQGYRAGRLDSDDYWRFYCLGRWEELK